MAQLGKALISVSDKTGVETMAKGLVGLGADILSTGGTATILQNAGVEVTEVAQYTGFPEIMNGRVKTLHPKIHGGLLGRRSVEAHMQQMKEQGILPIDVVVVNLYPFESTIAKPGCTFEEAIEHIDIGGPSMLRSAAKNHEDVLVIVDPQDYTRVLEALQSRTVSLSLRRELAKKVFFHTARYDSVIANYLNSQLTESSEQKFPTLFTLTYEKVDDLRYGENPHQAAAIYQDGWSKEASVCQAKQLHGKAITPKTLPPFVRMPCSDRIVPA